MVEAFRSKGLEPPKAIVVTNSHDVRKSLLATGQFLSVFPGFMLRFPDQRSSLKALPVELPTTRRPIVIVTLKNRTLSPVVQLFIESVRAIASTSQKRG